MKNYKLITSLFLSLILSFGFSFFAYANSSWVWITETRPYDVLPFVIVATLIIETLVIDSAAKIEKLFKTFFCVLVGNILSFVAPYFIYANFTTPYSDAGYGIEYILDRGPFYTVGTVFLALTILIELPFIYQFLKKDTENKKKLCLVIITVNIATTALVALIERLFCQGHW